MCSLFYFVLLRSVFLKLTRMSISGDQRSIYFRDLNGVQHIWYASSGYSYLVPQRRLQKSMCLDSTVSVYNALIPLERQTRSHCRVSPDQLLLLAALHAVQYRCLAGQYGLCHQYVRDVCERYFAGRTASLWPKLNSLIDRYYGRFEEYIEKGVWMKGDYLTRTFIVTKSNTLSLQVRFVLCVHPPVLYWSALF